MIRIAVVSRSGMPVAGAAAEFGPQGGTIGRADANTLVLSDPERTVSRLHVTVECREGRFFGIDQGSNPMQHNGKLIGAGKAVALAEGDRLTIGCFELAVSAAGGAAVAQPTSDDPFADLLSGIGAPAPASAPVAAPAPSGVSQLFPDPMAMAAAPRAAAAPVSPDDPFADLLGSDTAAPQPGAIEDFSNLGLRAPDAAAGIDHLFDSAPPSGPGRDPLGMSPLADPLLQPNTAADADPFAALQQGAPKAAPAPKADHLSVEHFGFRPPQAVVPPQGGGSLLDDPVAPLPPTPPSQQRPTPAPRACAPAGAASDSELLAALLRGLNSPHQMPTALTPELMERIGALLRTSAEGTLQLLLARQEIKKGVHAEVTMIAAQANNPLKFSPTVEVALGHLLGPGMRGFMPPEEAMRDAYQDLRAHEFGVMVGMRAALAHVLSRFTPEELEKKITSRGALDALLPGNRKARLWDQFVALYGGIAAEAEDDFHSLFGKAFVQAYEEQMRQLKSGGGKG